MIHFCHNRNIFVCNRLLFLHCAVHIIYSLYVKYDDTLLNRQSARSYYTSGSLIDQNHLIAHGIYFIQEMYTHPRKFLDMLLQRFHCLHIRFLNADNGL